MALYIVVAAALAVLVFHTCLILVKEKKDRRAKAEVESVENLAEALVENSPRGVQFYTLNKSGRLILTAANRAADTLLGIDHASIVGKSIEEAFPWIAETEIPYRFRQTAREGVPWETDKLIFTNRSARLTFECMTLRTRPDSMAAVFSDVSERERSKNELEKQRKFITAAIDSLPGIFYLYEFPALRLILWNKNHETVFGYSHEEMIGKSISDWHPPESKEAVIAAVETVMLQGVNKIETSLVCKDGSLIPFLLTGNRFDSDGKEYLMGVGIDISERLEAESRLTEKISALGQLVTGLAHEFNTPLGAILASCETTALFEKDLKRILDYYRAADDGTATAFMRLYDTCSGNPAYIGTDDRARRKWATAILTESGMDKPEACAERLSNAGFSGDSATLADMARARGFPEAVSSVHELTSISRSVAVIKAAAASAANAVGTLQAYNRHNSVPVEGTVIITEQIDAILALMHGSLRRGAKIIRRYGNAPPVNYNPELLGQVWLNLIRNAAQAIDDDGTIEIAIETDRDGRFISVSVQDDGPGIPEIVAPRIFEPFFTTKARGEGLGLGLDVCKKILDRIGATIVFESRPGRTIFTVHIPIRTREDK